MKNLLKSPLFFINVFLLGLVVLLSININPNSTNLPSFAKKAIAAVSSILGEGSTNYLAAFDSTNQIGNSSIYDTGSRIGIGTTNPGYELEVNGAIKGNYVGTSPRTYLYREGLCLNGVCKTAWPSGGGGGVSKIIAGSNITISPTSGTGNVTIRSTGSAPPGDYCVFKRTGYSCPSWAPVQEGLKMIGSFSRLDDSRTGDSGHGYNITVCCTK